MAIPTEYDRSPLIRKEAPHLGGRFSRYGVLIRYDTAGSTLGLRAPDCAKESSTLWTLFI